MHALSRYRPTALGIVAPSMSVDLEAHRGALTSTPIDVEIDKARACWRVDWAAVPTLHSHDLSSGTVRAPSSGPACGASAMIGSIERQTCAAESGSAALRPILWAYAKLTHRFEKSQA